jgi:hypothetical protein
MALALQQILNIHPDMWRATQLVSVRERTVSSGDAALDT